MKRTLGFLALSISLSTVFAQNSNTEVGSLYQMTIGEVNIKHLKTNNLDAQKEILELLKMQKDPQNLCFRKTAVDSIVENFRNDCKNVHIAQTKDNLLLAGVCHGTLSTMQIAYNNPEQMDGVITWKSKDEYLELESEAPISFKNMNKKCL